MLPLDTVSIINTLNHETAIVAGMRALRMLGATGVMVDVWWGIVEADGPREYNWNAYRRLTELVRSAGLKMQAVMSFHACGCNVGDSCVVSLPPWVLEAAENDPDMLYTDKSGVRNKEYLSLGVDNKPLGEDGRTPLEMYGEFMESYAKEFADELGSTITTVSISMGPAGEFRYPAYPEGSWQFPGIGEFQCYDKHMLASLSEAAEKVGQEEWGLAGPHNAGTYNSSPFETGFFADGGSWESEYGSFFLQWYADELLGHGRRILSCASDVFSERGVTLAVKLPGIHWWYHTRSHAAELTAGLYNTKHRDGYRPVIQMLAEYGATLTFTCTEMSDSEQMDGSQSGPEGLLRQVLSIAAEEGVPVAGENAILRFDGDSFERITRNIMGEGNGQQKMTSFTFLRMGAELFQPENWRQFSKFVKDVNPDVPEELLRECMQLEDSQEGEAPPAAS